MDLFVKICLQNEFTCVIVMIKWKEHATYRQPLLGNIELFQTTGSVIICGCIRSYCDERLKMIQCGCYTSLGWLLCGWADIFVLQKYSKITSQRTSPSHIFFIDRVSVLWASGVLFLFFIRCQVSSKESGERWIHRE